MFGSVVLDVAIGMAFVYLLLSLIASVVQEMLAAFMQLRSANLERGLRSLFSGDSLRSEMDLVNSIYDHGLVRGLYSDPLRDSNKIQSKFRKTMNAVRLLARRVIGISADKPLTIQANPLLLPSYIPSRTFALALIDILNANKETGEAAMSSIAKALAEHDNKAAQALLTLAIDAKGDVAAFQRNLEQWYNDAMDRVSGWYKRYTQRALVVLGLLLAIVFNVNSVRVARTFWLDRDARQAMVNAAESYTKDHTAPTNRAQTVTADDQALANPTPVLSEADQAVAERLEAKQAADEAKTLRKKLEQNVKAFDDVTNSSLLPLGWKHPWHFYEDYYHASRRDAAFSAVTLLAGWLMTALAISFGAPFWFDTLNKFMVVRSTVKPQEKSKTDAGMG
jgi:hypothetical protein